MKQQKLFIIVTLICILGYTQSLTTRQVLDEAESALTRLVSRSKSLYSARCSSSSTNCQTKLYDECSEYAPELTCEQEFPFAKTCSVSGAFMNWDIGGGRCANDEPCNQQLDKEIQCSQAQLFADNTVDNNVKHDITSPIAYQYVGFYNSFRTIFPYQHQAFINNNPNYCQDYDPRYRPWYVGAATGAKNVVLVIDVSGSMGGYDRLDNAKLAAEAVVDTLGQQDYFGIVKFEETATRYQTKLQKATASNKSAAISYIKGLTDDGKTNYEEAFQEAFDMIEETIESEAGSTCFQNVILFLTDGQPTAGLGAQQQSYNSEDLWVAAETESADNLVPFVEGLNTGVKKSVIFTYALGTNTRTHVPERIACATDGIFYQITDANSKSELTSAMRSYYDYLALGLERDQPVWSESYKDSITGKDFITASLPIFVDGGNVQLLLGVAGVDIDLESLTSDPNYMDIVEEYQNRTRYANQCSTAGDLTDCQLYQLRGKACPNESAPQNCSDEVNLGACSQSITANPWVTTYPTGSDGNQVQYEIAELSSCCPAKGIQISSMLLNFIYILFIGCISLLI